MTTIVCHYLDGSPFARAVRVLARELNQPMTEVAIADFPMDPELFKLNPLGQVPVLSIDHKDYFPTEIALAALAESVAAENVVAPALRLSGYDLRHRQILSVVLALGDQIVARQYRIWAGLGSAGDNRLGFDMNERALERISATLDWLERRISPQGFDPEGLSLPDIALACFIFWTESRGPISWRGRARIEAVVASLAQRASFLETAPRPYAH